jgi:hypothetical protein
LLRLAARPFLVEQEAVQIERDYRNTLITASAVALHAPWMIIPGNIDPLRS